MQQHIIPIGVIEPLTDECVELTSFLKEEVFKKKLKNLENIMSFFLNNCKHVRVASHLQSFFLSVDFLKGFISFLLFLHRVIIVFINKSVPHSCLWHTCFCIQVNVSVLVWMVQNLCSTCVFLLLWSVIWSSHTHRAAN